MTPEDKDALKGLSLALLNRAQEFYRATEIAEDDRDFDAEYDAMNDAHWDLYRLLYAE